jgi:hypothetical protein
MSDKKMLLQVKIPFELHRQSKAKAVEYGKSLQQWVEEALEAKLIDPDNLKGRELTPREKVTLFQAWVSKHSINHVPPISDEAISRENLYGERG